MCTPNPTDQLAQTFASRQEQSYRANHHPRMAVSRGAEEARYKTVDTFASNIHYKLVVKGLHSRYPFWPGLVYPISAAPREGCLQWSRSTRYLSRFT
jgi:hypothetical protein